jgi:hypothetical protein
MNVLNVIAFHSAPTFLTSIANNGGTSSEEKNAAAACIVATLREHVHTTPAVAYDLISHGLDLVGWALDARCLVL